MGIPKYAIINSDAMNNLVHIYFHIIGAISPKISINPKSRIAGSKCKWTSRFFLDAVKFPSRRAVPSSLYKSVHFLTASANVCHTV